MDVINSLINDIINNLEILKNEYLNISSNSKMKIKTNNAQVEILNKKIIDIEIGIKKNYEELNKFNQNYKKIGEHLNGIENASSSYNLLEADQINKIKNDSLQKKAEITKDINNKIEKAKKCLAQTREEVNILNVQNKSINGLLPTLKSNYDKNIGELETTLKKLNKELISYHVDLTKTNTELNKEKVEKKVEKKEPVKEKTETKKEVIKDQIIEETLILKEEQPIDKENTEEVKLVEKKDSNPIMDYHMNQYTDIDKMNLSDSQKNKLINSMSSEKFIQIISVLNKYNIPLADITPFYNEFININDIENLEETLEVLKGLGKNNNDKDFSLMLDVIFESDNLILQDNLLTIYSKGENPKDVSIYKLTSPFYSNFDEQAKNLGIDGEEILRKNPISSMLIPISKIVQFNKPKHSINNDESIKKVA